MRRLAIWLSWLLTFVMPWEYLFERGALGTIGRVTGLALAGAWLLSALAAGRVRRPRPIHVLMAVFALWGLASILWSLDPLASQNQAKTYVQLVLLAVIVWDLYDEPAHLNGALQAYVLGCWVSLGTLLHAFLSGDLQRRFSVGLFNENTLGFMLALSLPVAWYLATTARSRAEALDGPLAPLLRLSNLVFIAASTFGIVLTASRAAMAGALIAFVYMALSLGRLRVGARVLLFAAAAAALVYGASWVPETSLERLSSTTAEVSGGDWNGRLQIWNEALRMISERPVFGVGLAAFAKGAVETGAAPHNFVLSLLAEVGLIGFAMFSGLLLASALLALRQPPGVAALWLTLLGIWLLNAATHVYEDKKITWLLFGLITVSDGLRRAAREPKPVPVLRPAVAATRTGSQLPAR